VKLSELVGVRALGLRIVVGDGGVGELPVTAAYITDLPDPSRFLVPGIVVLSSGLWVDRPGGVERFVGALVAAGATALVLGTVEIGEIPPEVVEVCRREGLVLASVPDDVSFGAVVQTVVEAVADLTDGDAPGGDLVGRVQQAVGDGALDEALALVHTSFAVTCWVVDDVGSLLATAGPVAADHVARAWSRTVPGDDVTYWPLGPSGSRAVLVAQRPAAELGPAATRVLGALAAALRPELRFARRSRRARWERVSALLAAAVDESLPPGEISALLRLVGLDPLHALRVLVARTDDPAFPAEAVAELLTRLCTGPGVRAAVCVHEGTATAVLSEVADVPGLRDRLAGGLPEPVDLLDGRSLVVATSDPVSGVARLGAAHAVALERLGEFDTGPRSAEDADLVVVDSSASSDHRSLLRMLSRPSRAAFAASVLGGLEEYDSRHGADLVSTVRVFLEQGSSWQEAARVLHIHPNTLRYRIARIEELTHRDLATMRDRIDVFLALECRGSIRDSS
jgi:hypothetical protein